MTNQQKTIQQQLQSRISKRRNMITELEVCSKACRDFGMLRVAREYKEEVNKLAAEQKLDKKLYSTVLLVGVIFGAIK